MMGTPHDPHRESGSGGLAAGLRGGFSCERGCLPLALCCLVCTRGQSHEQRGLRAEWWGLCSGSRGPGLDPANLPALMWVQHTQPLGANTGRKQDAAGLPWPCSGHSVV